MSSSRRFKAIVAVTLTAVIIVEYYREACDKRRRKVAQSHTVDLKQAITHESSHDDDDHLITMLQERLSRFDGTPLNYSDCRNINPERTHDPCVDASCPPFPHSPEVRLRQILATRTKVQPELQSVMTSFGNKVPRHKYVFVTAASSNHYEELQGLVDNLIKFLFPKMADDYIFVVVNLGMTQEERRVTMKNCRCQFLDFPFRELPSFFEHLKCYAWKPWIIASLYPRAEFVMWMDTSTRWHSRTPFDLIFRRAEQQGVQCSVGRGSIAVRTVESMFRYFGELTCRFTSFLEIITGCEVYHNEVFVSKVIMEPWVSCMYNRTCMCVENSKEVYPCAFSPPRRYNRCHRFEQSALGIIISKLYMEKRQMVSMPRDWLIFKRKDNMNWFIS